MTGTRRLERHGRNAMTGTRRLERHGRDTMTGTRRLERGGLGHPPTRPYRFLAIGEARHRRRDRSARSRGRLRPCVVEGRGGRRTSRLERHGPDAMTGTPRREPAAARPLLPPRPGPRRRHRGAALRPGHLRAKDGKLTWRGSGASAYIACAASGPTAGTVTFTGTEARSGAGQPSSAASYAAASQRAHSAGPYSGNGENSPHPAGPRTSAPSLRVTPRNRVRIGMANTRTSLTPPLAHPRNRVRPTLRPRAPNPCTGGQ